MALVELTQAEEDAINALRSSEAMIDQKKKQANKGDRFVQVNTKYLMAQSKQFKSMLDYQLINYFYDRMGRSNAIQVTIPILCRLFDCHRNTIGNAIKRLEELAYIRILKNGSSNVYVINADVAWKTGRDGKTLAIFNSVVVVDWDDQMEEHKKHWHKKLQPMPQQFINELSKKADADADDARKDKLVHYGFLTSDKQKELEL